MLLEFFPEVTKLYKRPKTMIYVLLVDFFCCSSEKPPATNAWVQFRVITSFKLLHRKAFYSENVPEVTQKLTIFNFKYFLLVAVF